MHFILKTPLLIYSMLLIGITAMHAQTDYDPKAKTILDDVSKTVKSYTSITATFTVTTKPASGSSDVRNGTAVISGSKYKVILQSTEKSVVYKDEYDNDGTTTWTFSEKSGDLVIDDAPAAGSSSSDGISVANIFSFYEKGYKYKFVEEKTVGGKTLQYIELTPEKTGKSIKSVKLTIDKVKKQIVSVTLLKIDGSSVTYDISALTPNLAVTDATFQFDQKSHTVKAVIDQR